MQLVGRCAEPHDGHEGGCIDMLDTMKNQRIDIPEVVEKFGVGPELVGDVLALMGDSVDNVPGIYGIGPKTASKLIQDYGSLEGALDAAPEMKPGKLRDRLIEGARDGRAIARAGAAEGRLSAADGARRFQARAPCRRSRSPRSSTEHGFTSLLRRLDGGGGSPARRPSSTRPSSDRRQRPPRRQATGRTCPRCRRSTARPTNACRRSSGSTTGSRAPSPRARWRSIPRPARSMRCAPNWPAVSLALGPNDACYIPLGHGGSDMFAEKPQQIDKAAARWPRSSRCWKATRSSRSGRTSSTTSIILARNGIERRARSTTR